MTYQELSRLCEGKHLPIAAKNEDGENVLIERVCEKLSYAGQNWERNLFRLTTAQHNGWSRINTIFEDGTTEEFYVK